MYRAGWLLLLLLSGCVASESVQCSSGTLCPRGTLCNDATGTCIDPQLVAACNGKADDDSCDAAGVPGSCSSGICASLVCGNGIVQPGEACDDGNRTDGDGCRGDCLSDETCGNGVIDYELGEQCDCGRDAATLGPGCSDNNNNAKFCRTDCKLSCGDGMVGPGEVCDGAPPPAQVCLDYGFDRGELGCSPVCTPGFAACGFIGWERIATAANAMYGVWGTSPQNVFLVGDGGVILHFDGNALTTMTSGTTANLRSVWGSSATDVYAVGHSGANGVVVHYDGTAWSTVTTPAIGQLTSVHGTSATDVWAVGAASTIHFDGTWQTHALPSGANIVYDVWSVGGGEAWAAAVQLSPSSVGRLLHFSAGNWTIAGSTTSDLFTTVWASSSSDVYAAGQYIAGGAGYQLYHYNGSTLAPIARVGAGIANDMWGSGPANVHVVDQNGDHVRWDGTALTVSIVDTADLISIFGTDDQHVFTIDRGAYVNLYRYSGEEWSQTSPSNNGGGVSNVVAFAADDVYWLTQNADKLQHWDGVAWTQTLDLSSHGSPDYFWAASDTEMFFALTAATSLLHDSNGTFTSTTVAQPAYALWGSSASDVFAVGAQGSIEHWTTSWNAMTSGVSTDLEAVWGSSGSDVFAAGAGGVILHYNGASWSAMTSGTTAHLYGVWGLSASDVYAVGELGTVLHYDGSAWTTMATGAPQTLYAVRGTSSSDLYASGDHATVLHYDGIAWSPVRSVPTSADTEWRTIATVAGHVLFAGEFEAVWLIRDF